MGVLKSFLIAATAYLKVLPALHLRGLYKDLDSIEDEIYKLAFNGSAASELRMEQLAKRKKRCREQISAIRSTYDHLD